MFRAVRIMTGTVVLAVALASVASARDEPDFVRLGPRVIDGRPHRVGELVADARFTDLDGKSGSLSGFRNREALVVAIRSVDCPVGRKQGPGLGRLSREYTARGVRFLFVDPVTSDTTEAMREEIDAYRLKGRYVADPQQNLARVLGATSTTEVFVLDRARTLVYRGAVDDQYGFGYAKKTPSRTYLRDALDGVLAGRRPRIEATTAPGCKIDPGKRVPAKSPVTYHNRISRILERNCVECHRKGEPAPFVLDTYAKARGNGDMIGEVVERRQMPPWFASHEGQEFSTDRTLSRRDRADLLRWVDADCPKGDPKDAPVPVERQSGWRIGKPDVVIDTGRDFQVPAEGVMDYVKMRVPTGISEDRWVKAIEVRPSSPQVVHHILVFAIYPKDHPKRLKRPRYLDGLTGFFGAMVPGQGYVIYPDGLAKFLPGGAKLRFQVHYTPNGRGTVDRPKIGLVFADGPPEREVRTVSAYSTNFVIPPGAANHKVTARYGFRHDSRILSFMPHMHLRGKAFRYELEYPDGRRELLLDIPRYDFNWQLEYRLRRPKDVPGGSRVIATAWFDNSDGNPANPDPKKAVRFGDQTFDEMMIGYIDMHRTE